MLDLRTRELAKLAVNYSVAVKPGENVIISGGEESIPFLVELYKEIILKKAFPIVRFSLPNTSEFYYKFATKKQLEKFPDLFMDNVKKCQAYIGINSELNTKELSSADSKKISIRQKVTRPVSDYIVNERDKIRRVTIAFPCVSHAQEAEMSQTEWENFVFSSCLINWKKLGKKLDKINKKFEKGKQVQLIGENIDLRF
jgi:aminopeptidase